jgi:hypothetical protein
MRPVGPRVVLQPPDQNVDHVGFFLIFFWKAFYFALLVTILHNKCYVVSEIISALHSAL